MVSIIALTLAEPRNDDHADDDRPRTVLMGSPVSTFVEGIATATAGFNRLFIVGKSGGGLRRE